MALGPRATIELGADEGVVAEVAHVGADRGRDREHVAALEPVDPLREDHLALRAQAQRAPEQPVGGERAAPWTPRAISTALSRLLFWTIRPLGLLAPMTIRSPPRARGLWAETTTLAKQRLEPAGEVVADAHASRRRRSGSGAGGSGASGGRSASPREHPRPASGRPAQAELERPVTSGRSGRAGPRSAASGLSQSTVTWTSEESSSRSPSSRPRSLPGPIESTTRGAAPGAGGRSAPSCAAPNASRCWRRRRRSSGAGVRRSAPSTATSALMARHGAAARISN